MDISFYQMGDIYKKSVLLKEFTAPVLDTKNSYQTVDSIRGPGNGPTTGATDTSPNQFKDRVMFPDDQELSNSQKSELLIKFFKDEIDEGSWDDKTKEKFSDVLDYLLGLESSDESNFSTK
jgi:hypothetical protein